jgi:hypothetical protein
MNTAKGAKAEVRRGKATGAVALAGTAKGTISPRPPSATLSEQLPHFRERRHLSQQQLADKLNELGVKSSRATIARTEAGEREVGLNETLQLAVALDVSPTDLFLPFLNEGVVLAPNLVITREQARNWLKGEQPLFGGDENLFRVAGSLQRMLDAIGGEDADEIARLADVVSDELARAGWESQQ